MEGEQRQRSKTVRVNFTDRTCQTWPVNPQKRVHIFDEKQGGLGLRVEPNGRRTFFWQRFVHDRPVFKLIGEVAMPDGSGRYTVKRAREIARELHTQADDWKRADYAPDKNPFDAPQRDGVTFGQIFNQYIERYIKPKALDEGRDAQKMAQGDVWLFESNFADWRTVLMRDITKKKVEEKFDEIKERVRKNGRGQTGTVQAMRAIQLARRMIFWAIRKDIWKGENPVSVAVKSRLVKFPKFRKNNRRFEQSELDALMEHLSVREGHLDLRDAIILALATGGRPYSDVLKMEWKALKLEDKVWTYQVSKGREPSSFPLCWQAVAILKARQARAAHGAKYVFPGKGASGHYEKPKYSWKRMRKQLNLTEKEFYDFRRTVSSVLTDLGAPYPVEQRVLNHTASDVTLRYITPSRAVLAEWLQKAADQMFRKLALRPPQMTGAPGGI